jgi:hypothetical protein
VLRGERICTTRAVGLYNYFHLQRRVDPLNTDQMQANKTGPLNITSISPKRLLYNWRPVCMLHGNQHYSVVSQTPYDKQPGAYNTFFQPTLFKKMQNTNKRKAFRIFLSIIHKKNIH